MKLEGHQQRPTIFVGESDHHGNTPLATEIVKRAHQAGMAGASVFRGVEGYGASNHIHTTRILSLSDDPVGECPVPRVYGAGEWGLIQGRPKACGPGHSG